MFSFAVRRTFLQAQVHTGTSAPRSEEINLQAT
jgi:hypothetical protein